MTLKAINPVKNMGDRDQILKGVKQRYNIVGNCDALNRAIELALKVASVDFSVLILGENGTGKEIIPNIIHKESTRKKKQYLALNCGAIPEGTIDSELFGHEEGAYTGSVGKREGYFAAADGGTLFLDEVGELPLQTQVKLLRVLETGEYIPVGANEPRKTNVRIVAATNVDMKRAMREGRFREDLFYRLAAVTINIPPLRERGNDIDMLFRMFALENQNKYQTPPIRLNAAARDLLLKYPWPGNVRQLKNVVDSMSVLCEEREVTAETLKLFIPADELHTQLATVASNNFPQAEGATISSFDFAQLMQGLDRLVKDVEKLKVEVAELKRNARGNSMKAHDDSRFGQLMIEHRIDQQTHQPADEEDLYEEIIPEEYAASPINAQSKEAEHKPRTMREVEEDLIRQALERNGGNRRKTANELNLSERTLYRKISEYGINS